MAVPRWRSTCRISRQLEGFLEIEALRQLLRARVVADDFLEHALRNRHTGEISRLQIEDAFPVGRL